MNAWQEISDHWIGWLITALAVSLGAPFWFDVLNKIIVIRSTVKPAEKSGPEASKDCQSPATAYEPADGQRSALPAAATAAAGSGTRSGDGHGGAPAAG